MHEFRNNYLDGIMMPQQGKSVVCGPNFVLITCLTLKILTFMTVREIFHLMIQCFEIIWKNKIR